MSRSVGASFRVHRRDWRRVAQLMVGEQLATLVQGPVLVEIPAGTQRPELKRGISTGETPVCAGYVHPIRHQVSTGPLDYVDRDR